METSYRSYTYKDIYTWSHSNNMDMGMMLQFYFDAVTNSLLD